LPRTALQVNAIINGGIMIRISCAGAIAALIVAGMVGSAQADGSSLPYGGGGRIQPAAIIAKYNASGERFRIEGSCQSSCTMLLAIKNVCIDPKARLLFHAALFPKEAGQKPPPQRQARMLRSYNAKLRNYLVSNHYVDTFEFHEISGADIIRKFGYRKCPD
jgi:hypothetical protein